MIFLIPMCAQLARPEFCTTNSFKMQHAHSFNGDAFCCRDGAWSYDAWSYDAFCCPCDGASVSAGEQFVSECQSSFAGCHWEVQAQAQAQAHPERAQAQEGSPKGRHLKPCQHRYH